jgi:hypothetical protein
MDDDALILADRFNNFMTFPACKQCNCIDCVAAVSYCKARFFSKNKISFTVEKQGHAVFPLIDLLWDSR